MISDDLKTLANEDVVVHRSEIMRDLMVAQFQVRTGQLEDSSQLPKLRKKLARLNTELRAREIAQNLPKGSIGCRQPAPPAKEDVEESGGQVTRRSRFGLGAIRDTLLGKRT